MCKDILDVRATDTELLSQINEIWDYPLRHWNPEHADPQEWHVEFAVERGDDAETVARLREQLAVNKSRIALKQEIVDWRALQRFGLLFWILRNVREGGEADRWIPAWETFACYFGDIARLARILDKGIEAEWEDRGRWSNWVLDTLSKRQAHGLAVDVDFVQTFVVLALSLVPPDGPPPQIDPMKFGRGRFENPRTTVDQIIDIASLAPLMPVDRLRERADQLVAGLEVMQQTRQEQEDQALIDAPIDDGLVDEFEETLRAAWHSARTLRSAFAGVGAVEAVEGPLGERSGSQVKRWLPKSLFVVEPRTYGLEQIARNYGRGLGEWEWNALVRAAEDSTTIEAQGDASPAQHLRVAIGQLRQSGYQPSLAIVPIDWRLFQALELVPSHQRGGEAEPPDWLDVGDEEHGRGAFVGAAEGVPVIEHQHVPANRLYVFDLAAYAKFLELRAPDRRSPVIVEINYYDEREYREMIEEGHVAFDEELSDEQKVRELQRQVYLDAMYPFEIVVTDAGAARRVVLHDAQEDF